MQLKSSVLSAAVKSALVAAGLAAGVASAMTPGAYEATAQGRNADVTVRVTVSTDKIEKIEIVKHSETPGIGDLAVNELPAAAESRPEWHRLHPPCSSKAAPVCRPG